jgi:hypothetical protein
VDRAFLGSFFLELAPGGYRLSERGETGGYWLTINPPSKRGWSRSYCFILRFRSQVRYTLAFMWSRFLIWGTTSGIRSQDASSYSSIFEPVTFHMNDTVPPKDVVGSGGDKSRVVATSGAGVRERNLPSAPG